MPCMLTIMMLILMNSILFLFLNHPLSLGSILLVQTILISMLTGLMMTNFWFSYIIFLIMVGGMLILFVYMTSIASNEKFTFSHKILIYIMMWMIMIGGINMMDKIMISKLINLDLNEMFNFSKNSLIMSKYMNMPSSMIFLSMIIYLLITLIVVVKISKINMGPLRQKF
uniref:NADH-ubiquinone oxidoreductase chain 6 n=1 Tax=Closteromerus claviger TaxID=904192 RepID=I7FD72_CLOCA|nr:NADH dehydrogenase subunit 6 [Closteromerus claviger]